MDVDEGGTELAEAAGAEEMTELELALKKMADLAEETATNQKQQQRAREVARAQKRAAAEVVPGK